MAIDITKWEPEALCDFYKSMFKEELKVQFMKVAERVAEEAAIEASKNLKGSLEAYRNNSDLSTHVRIVLNGNLLKQE